MKNIYFVDILTYPLLGHEFSFLLTLQLKVDAGDKIQIHSIVQKFFPRVNNPKRSPPSQHASTNSPDGT